MIRYALTCRNGHEFESWFSSADGYDRQRAADLVQCPHCGSASVEKALMAPALARAVPESDPASSQKPVPASAAPPEAPGPVALLSEREQAMRAVLRGIREHVTRTASYVGPRFAEEARRMHEGEIEHRSIYGEATAGEAKALIEDGIEVHPLPIAPDDRH